MPGAFEGRDEQGKKGRKGLEVLCCRGIWTGMDRPLPGEGVDTKGYPYRGFLKGLRQSEARPTNAGNSATLSSKGALEHAPQSQT